jgi:hypothetical protein
MRQVVTEIPGTIPRQQSRLARSADPPGPMPGPYSGLAEKACSAWIISETVRSVAVLEPQRRRVSDGCDRVVGGPPPAFQSHCRDVRQPLFPRPLPEELIDLAARAPELRWNRCLFDGGPQQWGILRNHEQREELAAESELSAAMLMGDRKHPKEPTCVLPPRRVCPNYFQYPTASLRNLEIEPIPQDIEVAVAGPE